jgi:C1A family cysteine protease
MVGTGTATVYSSMTQTQLKNLLNTYGPVMVGVYANNAFTSYSGGIFSGCPTDAANFINHAVLLIGYDDATSTWLIKNQWSASWGESGYIRIAYSRDCGVTSLVGNVVFSNINANPSVKVSQSLLFTNSVKWEDWTAKAIGVLLIMAIAIMF